MRYAAMVAILLSFAFDVSGSAQPLHCPVKPIEPCFTHHARLSSQNGIALKLWLIGTRRIVAVRNGDNLPAVIQPYLEITSPQHSYVYGDFTICPIERDVPGHMRDVCVSGAENLVVKNLSGARPPFRLLSTWRTSGRRE